MSQTIIISGGMIEEDFVESVLKEKVGAFIIGVDKGVEYLYKHDIRPQYIVGDFDSINQDIIRYYREETNVSIKEYNPIKDATDTEIAIRLAMTLGSKEIIILGATGGRIDHLWANIQTLSVVLKHPGVKAYILDSRNKVYLADRSLVLKKTESFGDNLSVFTLDGEIYDFSMKGTKWPLKHHVLKPYDSLTVSNRFADEEVEITFPTGTIVVMETRDM